jgi:hypothetical protein
MSKPASTADSIPSATTATAAAGEPQASQAREPTPALEISPGSQHSSYSATARRCISLGLGSQHSRLGQSARSFCPRSSEIFASTLVMFRCSGGKTGASMEMLQGNSGPNFEGYATIQRGKAPLGLNPFSCLKKRDKP